MSVPSIMLRSLSRGDIVGVDRRDLRPPNMFATFPCDEEARCQLMEKKMVEGTLAAATPETASGTSDVC